MDRFQEILLSWEPFITTYGDLASIVGLILTFGGFALTLWKIRQTRKATEEGGRIAQGTIAEVSTRLFSNQVADGVRLASDLRNSCQMKQWQRAIVRCEELGLTLASVVEDSNIRKEESDCISGAIDDLGLILRRLEKIIGGRRSTPFPPRMLEVLHTLTINLERLNGRLKRAALEIDNG